MRAKPFTEGPAEDAAEPGGSAVPKDFRLGRGLGKGVGGKDERRRWHAALIALYSHPLTFALFETSDGFNTLKRREAIQV